MGRKVRWFRQSESRVYRVEKVVEMEGVGALGVGILQTRGGRV